MELANYINYAMKSLLKNPILEVLQEIKIMRLLRQSNFIKWEVGYPPFQIILHFVFISTDLQLTAKEILATYKKRWNIEQGYKDLRNLFGLGQEENRIYEAIIAKITLSMFAYNVVSYINRIKHEPQTLGELFRDLECELESLAISMQLFIKILTKISEIQNVVKDNKTFYRLSLFSVLIRKKS